MGTVTVPGNNPPLRNGGFTAALRSEWTKLWSVGFTAKMLWTALLTAATMAAFFCLTTEMTGNGPLAQLSPKEVAGAALLGIDVANIVVIVLAAVAVGTEYSTGIIQLTLSATPARWKLLASKTVIVAFIGLLVGAVGSVLSLGIGQFVLSFNGLPLMSLVDANIARLAFGAVIVPPFYALIAVAFAFLFRNAGGAITATLALFLIIPAMVGWLPPTLQAGVRPLLPVSALHSVAGLAHPDSFEYLPPATATIALLAWCAAVFGTAYYGLVRRDA